MTKLQYYLLGVISATVLILVTDNRRDPIETQYPDSNMNMPINQMPDYQPTPQQSLRESKMEQGYDYSQDKFYLENNKPSNPRWRDKRQEVEEMIEDAIRDGTIEDEM